MYKNVFLLANSEELDQTPRSVAAELSIVMFAFDQ